MVSLDLAGKMQWAGVALAAGNIVVAAFVDSNHSNYDQGELVKPKNAGHPSIEVAAVEAQIGFVVGNSEVLTMASEGVVLTLLGSKIAAELEVSVVVCLIAAHAANWHFGFVLSIGHPKQPVNQGVLSAEDLVARRKTN